MALVKVAKEQRNITIKQTMSTGTTCTACIVV